MLKKKNERIKTRLRKGDLVQVVCGAESGARDPRKADRNDLGGRGRIKSIDRRTGRVVVEGLNMRKKAVRPDPNKNRPGGIIDVEGSIHISNVMLVCPKCDMPVRVGVKVLGNGKKARVCKKCGSKIGEEY